MKALSHVKKGTAGRARLSACVLVAAASLSACGAGSEPAAPAPSDGRSAATPSPASAGPSNQRTESPVVSAHGGGGLTAQPQASGASGSNEKPEMATPELDKKIAAAEAKAKRPGASESDKKEAAEAYFERGNLFFNAGNPRLYKFALGDLRRALRYRPDHAEAKEYVAELERIYRQMGRPVPANGLEP